MVAGMFRVRKPVLVSVPPWFDADAAALSTGTGPGESRRSPRAVPMSRVPPVSSTWPRPEPVYVPVRVMPLPDAGASWRIAPLAASRLPPVQLQLVLVIDSVPLSTSIVPPLMAEKDESVAVPLPVILRVPSSENVPLPVTCRPCR